jgi:hypothetical protein
MTVHVCPLKDSVCGDRPDGWCDSCPRKKPTYQQLEAQRDELLADAMRYRWLREHRDVLLLTGFFGNGCVNKTLDDVDSTIDGAIERAKVGAA